MVQDYVAGHGAAAINKNADTVTAYGQRPVEIVIIILVFPVIVLHEFDGASMGEAGDRIRAYGDPDDIVGILREYFPFLGDGIVRIDRDRGCPGQAGQVDVPILGDRDIISLSGIGGRGLDGGCGGVIYLDCPDRERSRHAQRDDQPTFHPVGKTYRAVGGMYP